MTAPPPPDQVQEAILLDPDRVRAALEYPTHSFIVYECGGKRCQNHLSWVAVPDANIILGLAATGKAPPRTLPPRLIRCSCGGRKKGVAAWRVPKHRVDALADALARRDAKPFESYVRFAPQRILLGSPIDDSALQLPEPPARGADG
jgi:hypothetical protein